MIFKRILILFLALISVVSLTGCMKSTQLNERALIQAVGVDLEEDGMIKLTLQIFSPATNSDDISASVQNANVIETKGKTISEAVKSARMVQGKQPFLGHCMLIIVGSDFAKNGLKQSISFFNSNVHAKQNISIVVAREKASDILKAKINQGILPAETLKKVFENIEENGILEDIKMFQFLKSIDNDYESSFLPMIGLVEQHKKSEDSEGAPQKPKEEGIDNISPIKVGGTALFADSKMIAELDDFKSRGILWIRDKINETTVITSTDKFDVAALKIYKSNSKLSANINSFGKISFTLDITAEATLGEAMVKLGETVDIEDINAVEQACSAQIIKECNDAFSTSVYEYNADIFNLGNIIWQKYPKTWKTLKDDWSNNVSSITLDVNCKVSVNRIGLDFNR